MAFKGDLENEKEVDVLLKQLGRAGKSGYTGLVLADWKFNVLDRMPKQYFANVEKVKTAAAAMGIEIIPAFGGFGTSNGLVYLWNPSPDGVLAHDPNLAEGVPVKGAPFVVKNGVAVPDAKPALKNGGFEEAEGDTFAGFEQSLPGTRTFADREVFASGRQSLRLEPEQGDSSVEQKVALRPWACYRSPCR
jgi:hypothetical protein